MKTSILFLFALLSGVTLAQESRLPRGWIEMQTPDPIILSWVKVVEGKAIESSPVIMIQKHELSSKWIETLDQITTTEDGCKKVSSTDQKDWNQLYCLINRKVIAILWRGGSEDISSALKAAKTWLYENE